MFYEHYQEMEARALKQNRRRLIEKGFTNADTVETLAQRQLAQGHLIPEKDIFAGTSHRGREKDIEEIFKPSSSTDDCQDTSSLISELTGKPAQSMSSKLIDDLTSNNDHNGNPSSEEKLENDSESERQSGIS